MKVTAALCWFDERPSDLEACVTGIANIADRVVAVDGAYRRFPGGEPSSPPSQAKTIRRVATDLGMECLISTPDRLWAGQLEKRTFLYQTAALGSDWVVVVDADHIIHADREAVRAELEALTADVVTAPYHVPLNPDRSTAEGSATDWHVRGSGKADLHRLLFRAFADLRVENFHWWVSGLKNGERVWVLREDSFPDALPAVRLQAPYEVEHRYLFRDRERVLAGRAFCNDRYVVTGLTGQEDDVPGLPEPVFDYDTVPF